MGRHRTARRTRGNDLVFGPLKALMTGYQLWGSRNACDTRELSRMFRMESADLVVALRHLAREGFVLIDEEAGTVSLTDAGARAMAVGSAPLDS